MGAWLGVGLGLRSGSVVGVRVRVRGIDQPHLQLMSEGYSPNSNVKMGTIALTLILILTLTLTPTPTLTSTQAPPLTRRPSSPYP